MDGLLAGIDCGTTHVKLVLATAQGQVVARVARDLAEPVGNAGAREQDPQDWWRAVRECLAEAGQLERVLAVGLTGQMQDLIPLSAGRPLRPALLYSDVRAGDEFRRLQEHLPRWEATTANQQDPSCVPAKLLWLAQHEPEALRDADEVLLGSHGYVFRRMTGRAACDTVTASTTGLLDVGARKWSGRVMDACGLDTGLLPPLAQDVAVAELLPDAAKELGLRRGIPVVHAMGDAGAATDGLVGSDPGSAYVSLGTTGWVAGVVDGQPGPASGAHQLVMPGWGSTLRIGAVLSAGATADWARRTFLPGKDFAELEMALAGRVGVLAERPLCLPGLDGERSPVRDEMLRGAFVGATSATEAMDFYLAALTGVAMGLRHTADDMGWRQDRLAVAGGGAASSLWRQILADVFEATIVTGELTDPGAWSALRGAAAAVGLEVPAPLRDASGFVTQTEPSSSAARYQELLEVHRGLYQALAPASAALGRVRPG